LPLAQPPPLQQSAGQAVPAGAQPQPVMSVWQRPACPQPGGQQTPKQQSAVTAQGWPAPRPEQHFLPILLVLQSPRQQSAVAVQVFPFGWQQALPLHSGAAAPSWQQSLLAAHALALGWQQVMPVVATPSSLALQLAPQQLALLVHAVVAPLGRQQKPASQSSCPVQVGPVVQVPPQPSPEPWQVLAHCGVQQTVPLHSWPEVQPVVPVQVPPQLSLPPLHTPAHWGVQQVVPLHSWPDVQPAVPVQVPSQPSEAPPQRPAH
jgi:hypothetical protein